MKTVHGFHKMKTDGRRISMITCYDYTCARIINASDIDAILVGDSVAMVMHGYETTVNATLDMIGTHVRAVKKGAPDKFIIADMPFLAHRKGLEKALHAVDVLIKAGAAAVKIEGARGHLDIIAHIVESGIPVMGHLGLTPQSIHQFGGHKVQAKDNAAIDKLLQDAQALQEAGIFAVVLELIPAAIAKQVTEALSIPTIGIGAGPHTSGQILVFQDLVGMDISFNPRFVRKYANTYDIIRKALNHYNEDIKKQRFPAKEESF